VNEIEEVRTNLAVFKISFIERDCKNLIYFHPDFAVQVDSGIFVM
jgi:hypothetical protein